MDGNVAVLTDYVATRWYRAPEILLGCAKYTYGVDMWSSGCILGELLGLKPIFPGTSTMNQLERITEVTGPPTRDDLQAIQSSFSSTMIEGCRFAPQRRLSSMFPGIAQDAEDLLRRLLQFNPNKRITAEEALKHPYVSQFHSPLDEPSAPRVITIPINDNNKFSIHDYRTTLYTEIVRRKKKIRRKMKEKEALLKAGNGSRRQDYVHKASVNATSGNNHA